MPFFIFFLQIEVIIEQYKICFQYWVSLQISYSLKESKKIQERYLKNMKINRFVQNYSVKESNKKRENLKTSN